MRLIDADALIERFVNRPPDYYHSSYVVGEINIAPVVAMSSVEEKPDGWISVKERLPDEGVRVLAVKKLKDGRRDMALATCIPEYKHHDYVTGEDIVEPYWVCGGNNNITHWMPLPEMPEEEENIMTETEKIIKGLQCCGQESDYGCDDCPYNVDPDDFTTCRQLYTDAVKQLKKLDALVKALELEKKEAEANE